MKHFAADWSPKHAQRIQYQLKKEGKYPLISRFLIKE